ncbi:hypothetical protein CERSUDRAFT_28738, partial [Gelatoporia subvermispora B]
RAKRAKYRLRERGAKERQAEAKKSQHNEELFESILYQLKEHGATFGDLLLYVSDPGNQRGHERYWGLFSIKGRVTSILKHWASSENSQTGRDAVIQWAVEYVQTMLRREGRAATRDGFLQASRMAVNANFALDFSLEGMYKRLEDLCPTTLSLLMSFSTTARQKRSNTLTANSRKQNCITTASLICLGARSQKNSYTRQVLGLYMYACGAQRQVISVLSHLGLCSSYPMIVGRAHDDHDEDQADTPSEASEPPSSVSSQSDSASETQDTRTTIKSKTTGLGLLRRLAEACRRAVRQLAQDEFLGTAYDNINFMLRIAEQILGRKDAQENGTCATAFPLFGATSDAMSTATLMASFHAAPPLSRDDVLLSPVESQCLETRLVHTVLRIIIAHGGASFSHFKENVDDLIKTSVTSDKIELHKTKIYPLPAMHIDESSITGNAEVVETIMHELGYNMQSPEFTDHVKVIAGDQLSITRLRSIALNRIGHDSFNHSFLWLVTMPGLFHYKMTATHGLMELFYGSSNSARNPGSLAFHNTVLDRKPIVMSSLPPFRVCRDLIFVSLYARVLHCLEIVVSCESLDDYAKSVTFEQLKVDAKQLVSQFANLQVMQPERFQPDSALFRPIDGDELFENAVLFMHGALMLREFTDAIKAGDSGRIILVLKFWALGFRGCGRTKYAHEVLHLLHNMAYVWPKDLRDVIVQNWLVNPTGCENAWVEVDLMQEHLNLWTKTIYKAHGSNASWDWLTMISPCIEVLRQLASQMNKTLGAKQGNKHKAPDLHQDIEELKRSLSEHEVYQVIRGRTLDVDKAVVPNVISVGLSHLGSALREFNAVFTNIQARLRLTPLVGTTYPASASANGTDAIPPSTEPNPRLSSHQVEGADTQGADVDEGSE